MVSFFGTRELARPSRFSVRLSVAVGLALFFSVSTAFAADADGDGMDDTWEIAHGLNPADSEDAFADLDGDRVPNLWEHDRGTNPSDGNDLPTFDAIVDAKLQQNNPTQGLFISLQAAYDSLPSQATYRSMVLLKRGHHAAQLNAMATPKKVLWIGEQGGEPWTEDAAILIPSVSPQTVTCIDETVFDSVIWKSDGEVFNGPALQTFTLPGQPIEMRLVNCVIAGWKTQDYSSGVPVAGAIQNFGAEIWLIHCTVWDSGGTGPGTADGPSISDTYGSGGFHLTNSIIWDPDMSTQDSFVIDGLAPTWSGRNNIIQHAAALGIPAAFPNVIGTIELDPQVHSDGWLKPNSPAINAGYGGVAIKDYHGFPRVAAPDIGADEFVDIDNDLLPDRWELIWFGSLEYFGSSDPDDDKVVNYVEFLQSTVPTNDADRDNLLDSWEIQYWGDLVSESASGNPDGDAADNLQEFILGSNPAVFTDFSVLDLDNDELPDLFELQHFGSTLGSQSAWTDFDGDGLSNGFELFVLLTDPLNPYSNSSGFSDGLAYALGLILPLGSSNDDADGDGLSFNEEVALGTNPFSSDTDGDGVPDGSDLMPHESAYGQTLPQGVAGPPIITLISLIANPVP